MKQQCWQTRYLGTKKIEPENKSPGKKLSLVLFTLRRRRRFHSENPSNVFRPHYPGGIWKQNNHRTFWICVWKKLGQGNHVIIVTSSFSKGFVFKMFSIHWVTQGFQIPPVSGLFLKSSVSVTVWKNIRLVSWLKERTSLPLSNGQSLVHACTGSDCVNCPTHCSRKKIGTPPNVRKRR